MAVPNFKPLLDRLLDKPFNALTASVIAAIVANLQRGREASALSQLDTEAGRLDSEGERLTLDNAVLTGALAAIAAAAVRNAALIDGLAISVQEQGVSAALTAARAMSLPGVSDAMLASVGVAWNKPSPEAIAQLIRFAQSSAFDTSLRRYGEGIPQMVRDIAIRGITEGRGPLAVARDVRRAATTMPVSYANQLMRSIQLGAYRQAVALSYQANASIISHQVRIAALDGRCCLACTALHGTRLEVGEVVSDHRNGRCTSIAVIRGLERLSQVETGDEWWARQSEETKLSIAGPGALDAMNSGRARLRDFAVPSQDELIGDTVRVASLRELGLKP